MNKQIDQQLALKILNTYGANPENWPDAYRSDLESFLKSGFENGANDTQSGSVYTELNTQASVDLHLNKFRQSSKHLFSSAELERMGRNILATLPEQTRAEMKPASLNLFARLFNIQPLRTGLVFSLVLICSVIIINQLKPADKLNTNLANSSVVEKWLWSEVNPGILNNQSSSVSFESFVLNDDDSLEEDLL